MIYNYTRWGTVKYYQCWSACAWLGSLVHHDGYSSCYLITAMAPMSETKQKCIHVFKFRPALNCHFDRALDSCTNVRTVGPRVSGIYVNNSGVTSIIAHSNNCDGIRSLSCSIANVKTPISRKSTEPPNRLIFCCARVEKISPPEVDNV